MRIRILASIGLALLVGTVPDAAGQDDTGPRITATVGGAFGVGDATGSVSIGAGYRFSKLFAVDAELGYMPSLDREGLMGIGAGHGHPGMDGGPIFGVPDPISGYQFDFDSHLLTFTSTVSIEVPVEVRRLRVFGFAGAGVSRFRERFGVSFGRAGVPSYDISETGLLLAAGAGTEVDVWKSLALGAEVRYFHVFGDRREIDVTRVAGRVGWRF